MTLEFLVRKRMISTDLYKFMKTYKVKSLGEAISFLECAFISKELRSELEEKRNEIERQVSFFHESSLSDLYLTGHISTRLYNCLQDLNFTNFTQVVQYVESNGGDCAIFLKIPKFGQKCLLEIIDIMSFMRNSSCNQGNTEIDIVLAQNSEPICNDITLTTTIESLHKQNMISVRTYNCLTYEELYTIGDVWEYVNAVGSIDKLLNIRNFGKKSLLELQTILKQVEVSPIEEQISVTEVDIKRNQLNDFVFRYKELVDNEIYKLSIVHYYETSKAKLSARSIHVLEDNFNSILEVVCSYFEGLDIGKLKNCGTKTYDELNSFIISLYIYVHSLFTEDCREAEITLLRNTYPFLSENELEFVIDYKMKTSHLPMFYILYHYLIKSSSRSERIFCRYYGLKGEPEDLRDISVSLDVSFERCRQLLAQNKIEESSLCSSVNWNSYDFFDNTLFYNNYDYKSILNNEGLGHLPLLAFAGLCSLVKNVKVCKMGKVSGRKYVVSEKFYNSFDLKGCIKDIESTLNKRCTEDINLPISFFIDSYWLNEPTFDVSEVEDIIIYILKEDYGVELGEDRILHIQQNSIDRSEEIYRIIEGHGEPMHLEQIRECLILRYPELCEMTIEQTRSYAYKHPHIVSLGKSSTYAIDKWELYTGTIRDLLYDILLNEKEPMTAEELYNEVALIYPNTNIKSITSTMDSPRFVRFVGSYYGIPDKEYSSDFVIWDAEEYSRKSFNERLEEFEVFLKSHHHLPRNNEDNEEEASLSRWYRRMAVNDVSITLEQQERLSNLLARNADYLVTATEYSFFRYCEEFKAFIEDNMEFPTLETDSAKYGWFKKNIKIYKDFEDRRKAYFEDLIEFLYTYGFEV